MVFFPDLICKDRLTRFGYYYLETMFLAHNVNIIMVKDENADKSV